MILIVEDEALIAIDLEETLGAKGYRTRVAATLEDAIEQAESVDLDLAILDYSLRGQSSEVVARILKDRGIPFVVSSGSDRYVGIDVFSDAPRLSKPFCDLDLEQAIQTAGTRLRPAASGTGG